VARHVTQMNETKHPFGILLREWRSMRRTSQMDLAFEAGVSARYLSCIESGKARPSREMVSALADALEMPLRERNALMLAAGFTPCYSETPLLKPEFERMRQAIDFILEHQEPYPAFVINRRWDVVQANAAVVRVNRFLMRGRALRHSNLLHQVFDPEDFRPVVVNWPEVAGRFIGLLHGDIAAAPFDPGPRQLLNELLAYPDVPTHWRRRDLESEPTPILNLVFRSEEGELRFFETITTFAGPKDVTLDELRIECSFPVDDKTAELCARLRRSEAAG
jgi:transcriptional regulator with XRE-family HTH domain